MVNHTIDSIYLCADSQQQPSNDWKGVFSVSSYTQYFNVDTDIVMNRLISSLYPMGGDFSSKIDANPDLWVFLFPLVTLIILLSDGYGIICELFNAYLLVFVFSFLN